MDNKRAALIGLVAVLVVAIVAGAVIWRPWEGAAATDDQADQAATDPRALAAEAAERFATAWEDGTLDEVDFTPASGDAAALTTFIAAGLRPDDLAQARPAVTLGTVSLLDTARDTEEPDGATSAAPPTAVATAELTLTWDLGGDEEWTYDSTVDLVEQAEQWLVDWKPAVVEPSLVTGEVLALRHVDSTRGRIVDSAGTVLRGAQGAVTVGIRPSRADDPEATARTVAGLVGVDPGELVVRVLAAAPEDFVEVATLERTDYDTIRDEIQPLPGTVFREEEVAGAVAPNYAKALLGSTGTATDEIVAESEGAILPGDITGLSGLEASQNDVLTGSPGLAVQAVSGDSPEAARTLTEFAGTPGRDVQITIDQRVQMAAEAVVADTSTPSALVAIRVSNGEVLAVANGPSGTSGFNRAMVGHYPPGSTFKVATTFGLLQNGLTPDTVIDCPASIVVGKEFTNADGEVLGPVPFRTNFADSCNTAFVGQADAITPEELAKAAGDLGYRELDVGTPVFGGSVPVTDSVAGHAAAMLGQGKVEASPFAVALASASVANGSSLQPRLVVEPPDPAVAPGPGLAPEQIAQLRSLMRSAVTDGTGGAVAAIPGGEVSGKTGTAEYGTESPPRTHAWFTGFQGDVAFAVLVEDGGFGGSVAAPIAANFLTALAGG